MDTYSVPHLLKATTNATVYLASLGHNVIMNKETGQLYVLYDTIESKDAFEVPDPLLIFLLVVSLVCIIFWISSEFLYTAVYNGSLYKVIYEEIKAKDDNTPMLMDCTHNPLAFEGHQVIPDLGEQASLSSLSSQEYGMVVLGNGSTEQPLMQQMPTRQTPILQDMPTQSPLLLSAGLFASAPTMMPDSLASPAFPASTATLVDPAALSRTTTSSYYTETTSLSSQPVSHVYSPPIPPRPN
ncbi:hypothetical protein BGZ91_007564, partial [Linnemannia elongata]